LGIPVKLASRFFASSHDGRKGGRSRGLISILILIVITGKKTPANNCGYHRCQHDPSKPIE
jgi:hypothetical protein